MNRNRDKPAELRAYVETLYRTWGRQHWWPADSAFEVVVGAFLTQNTAWTNVELAMANLRAAKALSMDGIRGTPLADLEQMIRPAGYFRQKAARLKMIVTHVDAKYGGSLERMFLRPTAELRAELLSLNGIGPETADSILLYAGQHEAFVVDAYTRRMLERHGMIAWDAGYEDIRRLFESALTPEFARQLMADTVGIEAGVTEKPAGSHHAPSGMSETPRSELAQLFNETHALIVGVGKNLCQARRVQCEKCPLKVFLTGEVRMPASKGRRK